MDAGGGSFGFAEHRFRLPWGGIRCRKSSRCLHHRLGKIGLQDLKRRIAVQTAVRLHSVIEINKATQLLLPMFRTVKRLFLMPHLHQGADNPLRFAVGLRTGNPGKLLTNPVLITGYTESMVGGWPSLCIPYRCRSKRTRSGMGRDQSGVRSETCLKRLLVLVWGLSSLPLAALKCAVDGDAADLVTACQ